MANVTTTWHLGRTNLSAAWLTSLLIFVFLYVSILVLGSFRTVEFSTHFEWQRYGRYVLYLRHHLAATPAVSILVMCFLRIFLTALWLKVGLKLIAANVKSGTLLCALLLAELVYIVPACLRIVWISTFQGTLNELPPGSFEPLMLPLSFGPFSMDLDSYWLIYILLLTVLLAGNTRTAIGRTVIWLSGSLLLGKVLWEMTWVFLLSA